MPLIKYFISSSGQLRVFIFSFRPLSRITRNLIDLMGKRRERRRVYRGILFFLSSLVYRRTRTLSYASTRAEGLPP